MSLKAGIKNESQLLFSSMIISGIMAASLWVIHLVNLFSGWRLGYFGIRPRDTDHWYSIFTGPLIHGDLPHLLSNTIPLLICGTLLFWLYRSVSWAAFTLVYTLTGLSVWLFARPVLHIGFSGVVYGLVSFLFWIGVFRRDIRSIVISLLILVTYSGYFAGIYPNQEGISWESHLMGGLVGILVAFMLVRWVPKEPEAVILPDEPESSDTYFLPRDIFNKDKDQGEHFGGWTSNDTR